MTNSTNNKTDDKDDFLNSFFGGGVKNTTSNFSTGKNNEFEDASSFKKPGITGFNIPQESQKKEKTIFDGIKESSTVNNSSGGINLNTFNSSSTKQNTNPDGFNFDSLIASSNTQPNSTTNQNRPLSQNSFNTNINKPVQNKDFPPIDFSNTKQNKPKDVNILDSLLTELPGDKPQNTYNKPITSQKPVMNNNSMNMMGNMSQQPVNKPVTTNSTGWDFNFNGTQTPVTANITSGINNTASGVNTNTFNMNTNNQMNMNDMNTMMMNMMNMMTMNPNANANANQVLLNNNIGYSTSSMNNVNPMNSVNPMNNVNTFDNFNFANQPNMANTKSNSMDFNLNLHNKNTTNTMTPQLDEFGLDFLKPTPKPNTSSNNNMGNMGNMNFNSQQPNNQQNQLNQPNQLNQNKDIFSGFNIKIPTQNNQNNANLLDGLLKF